MALPLTALLVLAGTTGFLVGQTGADATVLAAILPVLIAGGGAAAVGLSLSPKPQNGHTRVLPSEIREMAPKGVILFSASLIVGTYLGGAYKISTQSRTYVQTLQVHFESLEVCSSEEFRINYFREQLGQDPLPPEAFCPILRQ